MQLTIDSQQPLDQVLRVVGALYDVTLTVDGDAGTGANVAATGPTAAPAAPAAPAASRDGRRRTSRANGRRSTAAHHRKSGAAPASEVRRWARANGLHVSDRGRISASVTAAYRAGH